MAITAVGEGAAAAFTAGTAVEVGAGAAAIGAGAAAAGTAAAGLTAAQIASIATGVLSAANTLLAPKPKNPGGSPAAPTVQSPTEMPTVDDAAVQLAKKRTIAEQQQAQGRASTILTAGVSSDKLGA